MSIEVPPPANGPVAGVSATVQLVKDYARQETIDAPLVHTVAENLGLKGSTPPSTPVQVALPAEAPVPAVLPPVETPPGLPPSRQLQPKVDLAEIDRYLEALGKL